MQRLIFVIALGLASVVALLAAHAGDDLYSVAGVPVDASAASASTAQNIAINAGRNKAWTMLYRRLTKQQDWPHQPVLDDVALQRLVSNYVVSNERRSTTRYVANVTYVFNPDAVRRLLRTQNVAYVDIEAKPVLIVPMAPSYVPHSAWTNLWANPKYATAAVPMVVPVGDAIDAQALGALNFATAQWQDVEPTASRLHATEAFLVQATSGKGVVTVAIRRLGPGASAPISNVSVPVHPGQSGPQLYGAAADATATAIVDYWKAHSAVDFNKRYKLTADAHISTLADWGTLMQKLSSIPTVTDVTVTAMDIGDAHIVITYVGSADQLEGLAAQSNVALTNSAGAWQLALGSPPVIPAPTPAPAPQ
ncbi:MAG TPA: DUF2066 domain-containing protein [Rhizomicrobium sp.]|nr:DUF2066 domain-containing protein [Rhizomicrobium sp.]